MLLDGQHRVVHIAQVAQGAVNTVGARMADLFSEAVKRKCTAVILAHNHPSGDATPSDEDAELTRSAAAAGKILGVEVLDHVVVARGPSNYVSLREHGIEW
jgi:DNA repair protein RadC